MRHPVRASETEGWSQHWPAAYERCKAGTSAIVERAISEGRLQVSGGAFPSWKRSILTEIYLCHACFYHEIEGRLQGRRGTKQFEVFSADWMLDTKVSQTAILLRRRARRCPATVSVVGAHGAPLRLDAGNPGESMAV